MFFVYIIYSEKFDKYYIGQTNDFDVRLKQHNDGRAGFTSAYRPWQKVVVLEKSTRTEAMKLEKN